MGGFVGKAGNIGPGFFGGPAPAPPGGHVTFQITAGFSSNGPFVAPFAGYTYAGGWGSEDVPSSPSGDGAGDISTDPLFPLVNGVKLVVVSSVELGGILPRKIAVVLPGGALTQNFFTSIDLKDSGGNSYHLLTSAASFNALVVQPGFGVWMWPQANNFPLASNQNITISW